MARSETIKPESGRYGTASDRVSRASDVLRGEEDSHILGKVGALLIGVGVGVGQLIAPARGEENRAGIAEKVSDFGDKVREGTGTVSGDADAPVVVRRADLKNYFKGSVHVRGKWIEITAGTLVGAWNDLDRVGIGELTGSPPARLLGLRG